MEPSSPPPPPQPPQWAPPEQQPQYQQPPYPQQPQWTPPPQQTGGWGATGYGAPPPRPMGVTLGSVFLIIMGVIYLLVALLLLAGGAFLGAGAGSVDNGTGLGGAIATLGAIAAAFVGFWAVLHLLGGIGSLRGRGWGRWIGVVVAVITVIFSGLGLLSAMGSIGNDTTGFLISVVVFLAYLGTAFVLITAGRYFSYPRA